ncbi:DUF262 domain-containing protein [Rhizobium ruizarguesonis]|uniref:DUF262 domain-containing protein n=1 Tax=Rhizobium ruizarguesonis TaxID=2081791 RepID=UPI00103236F8|nr:DUF262 domain-containing protein [Rhizobium ruizarguesonis]TAY73938.1 DUF262 domain-containing protein [Rhizobium ruizarguesonis]
MLLNPLHLSVAKLFESRLFRIPDYQRAYSWQKKQRDDLFGDIDEAYRSGREHFMATVVALARETRSIAADEFRAVELVDGQQRITTIVVLLKAIEKALQETGDQSRPKRDLGDLLVKGDDHSLVLLQTNHDSSNVFTTYLRKGKLDEDAIATASDQNLIDAARECEAFVAGWAEKGKLIELLATVKNRLSMIYHELGDEATVYRVFEVLNSRGLDVRWIDKTKSQMMSSIFEFVEHGARADGLNEMREIWKDIYRKLGMKLALGNEALRFAGTFSLPDRPNRVLGEEEASIALLHRAGKEISTIVGSAEWLRRVVRLVHELNSDVRRAAVTKIAQARFLAIAIMLREFNTVAKEELLGEWEKVTFRIFALGGADTRMKVGEYVRLAHDVLANELEPNEILRRTKALGASYEVNHLLDAENYWDNCYEGWTEELRYLLFRYDEHLAEKAGEKINALQWNKIWTADPSKSIEHIVPQSQEPAFKHHLGNLAMLPPGMNSSLQADPPEDKADAYLECGIRGTMLMARTIKRENGWTEVDVKNRAADIEQFVRSEWTDWTE